MPFTCGSFFRSFQSICEISSSHSLNARTRGFSGAAVFIFLHSVYSKKIPF